MRLSVPRVLMLLPHSIPSALMGMVGDQPIAAVRQAFHGELRGEAIALFDCNGCRDLAELMGYDTMLDETTKLELLLDVSNLLIGACLRGVAVQLKARIGFSAPEPFGEEQTAATLFPTGTQPTDQALFVEVNFHLERRSFACHLVILMPENKIDAIHLAVDRFLASHA